MKPLGLKFIVAVLLLALAFSACTNSKDVIYFGNTRNVEFANKMQDLEPVIQPNDLLSIFVSSLNPEASEIFNVSAVSSDQDSECHKHDLPITGLSCGN
jgi:polysaccharide biosynthesis/export protein